MSVPFGYKHTAEARAKMSEMHVVSIRHGHAVPRTPTYRSWLSMLDRCRDHGNASWKYYGGRGISVCERWRSFEHFLSDMGARPAGLTLDRKNNNGHYEPGNVRWATYSEQRRNQRRQAKAT